jgi:hypothetical protein
MKNTMLFAFFLSLIYSAACLGQSDLIREKKIGERELPGYKISPTNSILLEQSVRSTFKKIVDKETENIEVHMKCKKKWRIRGRKNSKAYQCHPIFLKVLDN